MKRYWLFNMQTHYPNGGIGDMVGSFDKWEDALLFIKTKFSDFELIDVWFEIFDSDKNSLYELGDDNETIIDKKEIQ